MAKLFTFIFFLLILSLQTLLFPGKVIRTFKITNNCSYTVWPAASSPYNTSKFSLQSQGSTFLYFQDVVTLKLWGRTNCTNSTTGRFACLTGDCGTGYIDCSGSSELPPGTTLAEFGLNRFNNNDFYDVSLVNGYNVPVAVVPQGGNSSQCAVTGCVYDVAKECPQELRLGGACQSPCNAFNNSVYCCDSTVKKCQPTVYSSLFKKACPRAYSYSFDDATSTFTCGGSPVFAVTFCPSSATLIRELSKPLQSSGASTPSLAPTLAPVLVSPPSSSLPGSPLLPFPPQTPSNSMKARKSHLTISIVVAISISIVLLILLFSSLWICMKKRTSREIDYVEIEEIRAMESLLFDINTIKVATRNFSIDNKLGEGGFGEVYQGKLESGQEVAVKRLLQNSKQGAVEFKTEVVLVAKLQHKNLVKLLGFCMTSKEKILVYEFLPNSSLDKFLFDPTNNTFLDWQRRLTIIIGIARGLMYLHEDSRLKVIHRDLKTSNILLDEAMNPKISDFGLAKLFVEDQTQGNTKRIVGTYGYMAPEYAITGHYSVKSDVYSFGVIVLEIISGQKNRLFGGRQLEEALLHRAWRLWSEGKAVDLVDTRLNENFPLDEVMRCFHIGLLSIQEDAIQRPGMRLILDALSRPSVGLPDPKPPRFLGNPSDLDQDHQTLAYKYTGTQMITDLYPRD